MIFITTFLASALSKSPKGYTFYLDHESIKSKCIGQNKVQPFSVFADFF